MINLTDLLSSSSQAAQEQSNTIARRDETSRRALTRQQLLNRNAAMASEQISEDSYKSAAEARLAKLEFIESANETTGIAQEAMRLSDSDNPMDRMRLWFLQQNDSRYTREGNLERLNYLTQAAQVAGMEDEIKQQGFQDELQQLKNDVDRQMQSETDQLQLDELEVQIGENRLASIEGQAVAATNLANHNERNKVTALEASSPEELGASIKLARDSGLDKVTLGSGIEISMTEAVDRQDTLIQRGNQRVLREQTHIGLELLSLSDSELDTLISSAEDGRVTLGDRNISVYTAMATKSERVGDQNTLSARGEQTRLALEASQLNTVQGMGMTEVYKALQEDGKFEGESLPTSMLQARAAELTQQAATSSGIISQQVQAQTPAASLTAGVGAYDAHLSNDLLSPELKRTMQQGRDNLVAAIGMIPERADSNEQSLAAMRLAEAAREHIDVSITKESMRLANDDEVIAQVYNHQLRGQPVPERVISEVLAQTLATGGSASTWLPPAQAEVFNRVYQESIVDPYNPNKAPTSTQKANAITRAMEAVKQEVVGEWSGIVTSFQVSPDMPDLQHPLQGVISPEGLMVVFEQAEQTAAARFEQQTGIKATEIPKDDEDNMYLLSTLQQTEVLIALDTQREGNAKAYAEWWDSEKRLNFGGVVGPALTRYASGSVQEAMSASLMHAQMPALLSSMNRVVQKGYQLMRASELQAQRDHFLAFNGKQLNRQVYFLQRTESLTDAQKRMAMQQIVQPILMTMESEGMNDKPAVEQNARFEELLLTNTSEDASVNRLRQAMLSSRSDVIRSYEDIVAASHYGSEDYLVGGMVSRIEWAK